MTDLAPVVSDAGKAGEVVDAAAERRVARRELVRLDSPVVGWLTADIRPDGSLEPGAGGVHGEAYTDTLTNARECERPHVGTPPVLGGSGLHPVVASVHAVPFPFCSCGLPCDYEPHGRLFDHYRDRLGYRMRTVALVEVWGRLMVQNAGVRGEHGRVLAIAVANDDPPQRRERAEAAARRLGATIVEVDPGDFKRDAMIHLIPPEARLVTHHDFERLAHKRTNRRWSSAKQAMFLARVVGQINGLVAVGIGYAAKALGASNGAAIAVGVAVALAGLAFTIRKIQDVEHCVEAFAPSPEGLPQGAAEPIRVTTGRPQLNLGPAVAGVANLTR